MLTYKMVKKRRRKHTPVEQALILCVLVASSRIWAKRECGQSNALKPGKYGLKCSHAATSDLGALTAQEYVLMKITAPQRMHYATASS